MLVAVVLTGACGGDDGNDGGSDPPGASTSSTTSAVGAQVPEVDDWLARDLAVDLGGGFLLTHCEGDAPILCLSRDGESRGIVELSAFPVASLDEVRQALPQGPRAALEAHAGDHVRSLRADRIAGCGEGYTVTPLAFTVTEGPAGPVISYGFTGARRGEPVSERTVQWAALRGDDLVLLNLSGYDDGACVPAEGEGTVADVVEVERRLRPVVEANPLPAELGAPR
jgi:hypothetical protein